MHRGEAVVIRKAVCIHEEDTGILWKHWDCYTNHAEVRGWWFTWCPPS